MRAILLIAALSIGVALGAIGAISWSRLHAGGSVDASQDLTTQKGLSDRTLARVLFERASKKFIARAQAENPDEVGFFFQPTLSDKRICSIEEVRFPGWLVSGGTRDADINASTPIYTIERFAIWNAPGELHRETAEQACARYRDFNHLIEAENTYPSNVERVVEALIDASAQAKSGKTDFKLTCVDARNDPTIKACDGRLLLAKLNVRDISSVRDRNPNAVGAEDRESVDLRPGTKAATAMGCDTDNIVGIEVSSSWSPAKKANKPDEVDIRIESFC